MNAWTILGTIVASLFVILAALVTVACVQVAREGRRPDPIEVTGDLSAIDTDRAVVLAWCTRPARMAPSRHAATVKEVRRLMPTLAEQLDRAAKEQERTFGSPSRVADRPKGPRTGTVQPGTPPPGSLRARAAAQAVRIRQCEERGHLFERSAGWPAGVYECTRCGRMQAAV